MHKAVSLDVWWDFLRGDPERDRRNLRLLMETARELHAEIGPEERMRRAVDRAIELTGAERCVLLLLEGEDLVPQVARDRAGRDLPLSQRCSRCVLERVRRQREPFRSLDAADNEGLDISISTASMRLVTVMATPLEFEDRFLGILYLDATYRPEEEFGEYEEKVLRALAGLIGAALENARLERARAERDRIRQRVETARHVQQKLQPRGLPRLEGFQIAGVMRVCEDMSGDYYDVIPSADGRYTLVVGDVSGHGISQAMYTVMTRALLHVLVRQGETGPSAFPALNEFLERTMDETTFMTLFAGTFEPKSRSLVYASAGHQPALLRRADGRIERLRRTGLPLGIYDDVAHTTSAPVRLESGDVLVLYTDGFEDARNAANERYEEERLLASLAHHAENGSGADAVLDGLLADLDAFRGSEKLPDDLTALVVSAE